MPLCGATRKALWVAPQGGKTIFVDFSTTNRQPRWGKRDMLLFELYPYILLLYFVNMIVRKATYSDAPIIWEILQQAIEQRRQDGSDQWQNGYPNEQTVHDDIANGYGYVLVNNNDIWAYAAIIFGIEPAYNDIIGAWLTSGNYAVVHRVAVCDAVKGKGIATLLFYEVEHLCTAKKVYSIKVDTNFDNRPMLKILANLGYQYCGEIFFNGAPRKAFEKVLANHE